MITYLVKFDAHAADFGTITVDEQMIDPNSYVKEATENSEYVFRIEVANGYEVETVRANDMELVSDGSPDKYRIAAVTEDTVIAVVYREAPQEAENAVQHVVSFQTGEGASVTVDGADATNGTAMAKDGKILFTVAAQEGFSVTEVLVDGTIPARTTGNPNEYIIEGIQTDATVVTINTASAQTEETETEETEMPVTENLVTFQSAEGATVIVDGRDVTNGTATAKNGTLVFTAAPAEGFRISEVLVDGEVPARTTGNTGEYIIEGIMTDDTVVIVNTAPIEEKEDEETQEQEKPAQTMTVTASDGATVIITAPQGALPEGAQVIAQVISSAAIENAVADAVAAEGKALVDYKAYDITIIDGAGNVIQPDASVQVTINNAGVAGEKTAVYHVEGASADKVAEVPGGDYAAFAAAHFSIYVVAGSQTEQPEVDEVLVTYNRIYDNGVAVVPPDTVAYDLTKEGITTEYAVEPQEGYTIAMSVEGEGAEYFRYENGKVVGSFTASGSYEVVLTYTPNEITYMVTHYYQNVDRTGYDEDSVKDTLKGKVNTMTAAQERRKEGFTVQHIEQDKIPQNARDNQINVKVYYDRNECLLTYNTMGGSYIESEILAYGAEVELPGGFDPNAPVREGYRFTGWYLNEACTDLVQNNTIEVTGETTVYAGWEGDKVNYTVVYMAENADDENYSYINSKTFQAVAGTTVQVSSSTHGLNRNEFADYDHFTFEHGTEGEIAPDGSTVLLAYYKRKEYTLTFTADALVCGRPEHKHIQPNRQNSCYNLTCTKLHRHSVAGDCYKVICGLQEHQHSARSCYDEVTRTITAKYEQDISKLWNDAVGPGTPLEGNNWEWDGSKATAFQPTMPGENKNLTPKNNGNTRHELHYYIEDPNGTIQYREKTFRLYTDVILNVSSGSYPTFNEEFFEIDGYERFGSSIKEWADGSGPINGSWGEEESFYYTRATYDLYLKNGDEEKKEKVPYLSDISGYLTPPTQSPIPEGTFIGWYLDPEFTTPFTGTTMPKGLSLYAKWEPKSFTVTFVSDDKSYETQNVIYGNTAKQPVHPPWKDEFIFEGWYTSADGDDKYDFNAPVTENGVIYAKWTPITDTVYRVDYVTADERTVAESKNGTGTVGEVIQEFAVKPQGEYFDYTVDEAEKTLKLTANTEENVIQFIYTRVRELRYTIEYRDMATGTPIYSRKDIPSNANQLVVHPTQEDLDALDNEGYELVDHHKNVELTVNGDNIVVFRCKKGEYTITYTGDENAAYPDGTNPTTYTFGENIALHNPQKLGYEFTGWKFVSEGGETSGRVHDGMKTLIEAGSHGNLDFEATWRAIAYTVYYDANGGTPTPASKTNVTWNQGALLPLETPVRNGYKLTGWTYNGTAVTADQTYASLAGTDNMMSITLTAQWTEDFDAKVRVTYEADPSTGGSVSGSGEDITIVSAQGLTGAVASETVNGYRFEGWYQGTTLVTKNLVLSRQDALSKLNTAEDGTYLATTFTAKFAEADNATLTYVASPSEGGTVTNSPENIAPVTGQPKGSKATATPGYVFVNWTTSDGRVAGTGEKLTRGQIDRVAKENGVYVDTEFTANFVYDTAATADVTYEADPEKGGRVTNPSDKVQIITADGLEGSTAEPANGYKFVGWFKDNEQTAFSTNVNLTKEEAREKLNRDQSNGTYTATRFTAKFEVDETVTTTVTYESSDETMGTVYPESETIQIVTAAGLNGSVAAPKQGYKFTGWYKGSELVSEDETLTVAEAKSKLNQNGDETYRNTTFVARFSYDHKAQATISYQSQNENWGTVAPGAEIIQIVPGNPNVTVIGSTATPKAGYKFDGWYKGDSLVCSDKVLTSEEVKDNLNTDPVNNTYTDTTFEARFSLDENAKATATYRTADRTMGTVFPTSSDFQIVDAQELVGSTAGPGNGYRFVGWYKGDDTTTSISTDAALTAEIAKENLNKNQDNGTYTDTVFTARFEIDPTQTVKVYYKPESQEMGRVTPSEKEIPIRDASGLTDAVAEPEPGYVFTGWYLTDSIKVCDTPTLDAETAKKYLLKAADGSYRETTFWASFADASDVTLMYLPNPLQAGTTTPGHENLAPATGQAGGSVATPNNGYKFISWTTANGDVVGESLTLTGAEVDKWAKTEEDIYETKVFRANFAIDEDQTATVTYTAETGGSVDNPSDTIQIVTGNTLTGSTAAAAKGYRFIGWYKGEEQISRELSLTPEDVEAELERNEDRTYKDTTFTAKFEPDPRQWVTVSYQSEDQTKGTVDRVSDFIQIVTGEPLNGSAATAKPGYKFVGWYKEGEKDPITTKTALTAAAIKNADALNKAEDGTYTATAFIAKFAYDEAQEVTISYESSNKDWGTVDPGSEKIQIVPGNPDASIKGSAATALTGYKFVGWYKGNTPVSAAAQLDAKSIKNALNKDANGNYAATTFTAKFDYDETALATVTYVSEDAEKGTVDNGSNTIQIRTGEPLSGSKAAATAGYQFDGWYKGNDKIADSAVLSAADAKKALDINEDGTYKDTTFTAKFVIDETQTADVFYVSEDAEKGTVSVEKETIQIVTGEPLEGSKATAKAGYRFTGWKKSVDGSDLVVAEQATLDGTTAKNNLNTLNDRYTTTTFIATFTEQDNVTLTYAVNPTEGGTVTNSPESLAPATGQSQGSTATATPGYKFTGWTANGEEAGAELVLTSEQVDAVAKKTGIYEATTFTANFAIDEDQTVEVTYEADPTEGGTVTNSSDTIQIVTADGLTGSKAEAAEGYKFIGWYKGNQFVTAEAELNVETALKFLEKPNGKTYVTTVFTARFEIDPTQTKELSATVDYMLAQDLQPEDHVELKETVQVLQPDTLSTAGVTGKSYPGWKLDKITVNGETVETLPSEVDDKAKVIYHYIADFVDLDAAGFEEFYSGQTYQVSVTGTLEGDVIRFYKTDAQTQETAGAGEEIPNSFVNVSDSTAVLVEVTRGSNEQTWTKTVNAAVKPVEVELTADSGQKVYDGTPLEVSTYKITAGAFVADEGLEIVTIEGSQTYVGSSAAEITAYTFKKGTLEENYRIICKPGTLTVTEEGADPDDIMTKTHEGKTYGLGDVITFTIKVKNIYDKSCDITINEQQGVKITGESKFTAVKPGEEVSTTAVYTVTEADLLVGRFTNTVTASIDENTHTATDTTDTFEDPKSHLTVDKKTTSTPKDGVAYTPGETITYAVTAVNDGNLTLTDVKVVDELTGDVWKIKSLAPGESQTFEAEYLVTEADMENGTVKNVATAVVETPDPEHPGTIIVPGNTEDPIVTEHASLWLEKTVDSEKDSYEVGDTIRYTIHVVNNGNVTIRDIEVRDPLTGDTWTIEALAPQEKQEFHTTYKVTEEDAKKGSVTNTAEVIGTDPGDNEIKTDGSVTVRVVPKPLKAEMSKDDMPKGGVPKTGDETAVMQWLLLMAIAAGTVLTGTLLRRKRKA